MEYYVIYTVDVPSDISIVPYKPPNVKAWNYTEGDESYEYNYLEGIWENGKHRKYTRLFHDSKSFERFVDHTGLYMEDVETMGSLTEYGHLPAVSFNSDDEDAIQNAYVTPLPMNQGKTVEQADLIWKTVRKALLKKYGS